MGATGSSPLVEPLGEDSDEIGPTEATEASLLHIPVAGAAPGLRAIASAVDVLAADDSVESTESLTDGAIGLLVDEVATGGGTHLSFCLFNEEGFGSTHQGGAGGASDGFNVASDKCVVGGGGNDGVHSGMMLRVKHSVVDWD